MAGKAPAYNGNTIWDDNEGLNLFNGGNGMDVLHGLGGDDVLHGNNGDDQLWGDEGEDTLFGDRGDDMLYGGVGLDTLDGGQGNDTLDGGEDSDRLDGGKGDDELTGGAGSDVFVLSQGNDTITDFSPLKETDVMIDFEAALTGEDEPYVPANEIDDGYANLDWSNAWVMDPDPYYTPSGYTNVVNSGIAVGYDAFGGGLSFTDVSNDFDFNGGYFASAWSNPDQVTFKAYDDGVEVGSATFSLSQIKTLLDFSTATEVTGRFTSVDTISIDGQNSHVAMDDLMLTYLVPDDTIDVADDMDVDALIASATYDLDGNVVLHHDGGSLTLVGVTDAAEVSADWFV